MKKRINKKIILNIQKAIALLAVFSVICFPSFSSNNKVVENIDYVYLHIGLEMDYPLPEEFKNQRLKFEGNYKRYTSAVYRKSKNDLRFKPLRKGSAIMIIKNQRNEIIGRLNIDVQKDNLHKIAAELRDLLIAVDGIEVKIVNKKVIIDGQILLPREMDRIQAVIAQYDSAQVQSIVTFSPEAQKKIAEIIEQEIGYPEVTVKYAYNRFLLEGCVSSDKEKDRAQSIADLYTQFDVSPVNEQGVSNRKIGILTNKLEVPCESGKKEEAEERAKSEIKKLIQIVVHFVEMNKNFNKGFLFQWTPAIAEGNTQVNVSAGTNVATGVTAALQATVSNFFPKLNWAKSFNFARVLHNSSLLVEESQTGTITASVIVPKKIITSGTQTTETGGNATSTVSTTVTPTIIGERSNLVRMDVKINVSSPTGEGTANRRLNTYLHVPNGSSAVIGGIITSDLSRNYNKDPGSGIEGEGRPIINLLSSKNYNTTKSQFVVFITPLIKSSSSTGVERIKRKFKLDE